VDDPRALARLADEQAAGLQQVEQCGEAAVAEAEGRLGVG
jgi:hypothetical protein